MEFSFGVHYLPSAFPHWSDTRVMCEDVKDICKEKYYFQFVQDMYLEIMVKHKLPMEPERYDYRSIVVYLGEFWPFALDARLGSGLAKMPGGIVRNKVANYICNTASWLSFLALSSRSTSAIDQNISQLQRYMCLDRVVSLMLQYALECI